MEETIELRCSAESKPLSTLEQLLDWSPSHDSKSYFVSLLQKHKTSTDRKFKTLLCHDMKGGYLDDRFNDGSDNELAYRFFHWSSIDIFVYFSHYFISIPPLGWINAAHRNGVPVLGTFIVEGWTDAKLICNQIFSSTETVDRVISQLIEITKFYRFDGWLINIECEVELNNVETLVYFVRQLTDLIHIYVPQSRIIWYDSVTSPNGRLDWQNELNLSNKCFFDVCDGIFLNYTWKESNLKASEEISKELSRNYDVFVGIDVFGRNCFGGGGMNTKLAVNEILKYELSIAIFASGWTYEVLGSKNFTSNEYLFWSSLELGVGHIPIELPISTSFCQGFGCKLFKNGQIISDKPWHNLSKQQLQTSHNDLEIYLEDAYNGGGSLIMKGKSISLFKCNIEIKRTVYGITYKSRTNRKLTSTLNVEFVNESHINPLRISVNCTDLNVFENNHFKIEYIKLEESKNPDLSALSKYGLFETCNGWVTDCFILENKNSNCKSILKSIDLSYSDTNESDEVKLRDILIGQLILDSL